LSTAQFGAHLEPDGLIETQLVALLQDDYPDAAASLRGGLEETLTLRGTDLSESLE
jgi:hypothetical protein